MVQIRPPSPQLSNGDDLIQRDFHHLVPHNATTSIPQKYYEYGASHSMSPGSGSALASPMPKYQDYGHYYSSQQPSYSYEQEYQESGLGIKYEGYSPEMGQYGLEQSDRQLFSSHYGTPDGSSPAPSMRTPVINTMRTRSGLTVHRTLQPLKPLPHTKSKPSKVPKIKKNKKDKATPENKVAKLDKPLSELTKAWDHVPIVDIEAYVNRSAEERRKEVEQGKTPGKVKRPMNSFMLYRKAYQNRTKNWCLQNNHQVVSQVCGDSWPLEPESVREQFNEWSRIERINHQNAHPGYKFSPSKSTSTKSSKRKISEEPDSAESDLDDFDWEKGVTKRHKRHSRSISNSRSISRPVENRAYSATTSPYGYPQSRQISEEPSFSTYNKSSYQISNPGRSAPAPYNQANLHHGQYYQQIVHQNMSNAGVIEDVLIKKTATPSMGHLGLPGGHAYAMTDPYLSQEESMTSDSRIDPSLIAQDHGIYGDSYIDQESMYFEDNLNGSSQWYGSYGKIDRSLYRDENFAEASQSYGGLQINEQQLLKETQDGWSVEPLDVGQEFDKWMDESL